MAKRGQAQDAIPGQVRCLGRCGKQFYSPDRCRVRFCPACKRSRVAVSPMEERRIHVSVGLPEHVRSQWERTTG
jgi:Zn finger protein HypA/HybF involved in hydrogenase expression